MIGRDARRHRFLATVRKMLYHCAMKREPRGKSVSEPRAPQAVASRRYRRGLAGRLDRIEAAVEDLTATVSAALAETREPPQRQSEQRS